MDFVKHIKLTGARAKDGDYDEEDWLVFQKNVEHVVGEDHQMVDNSSFVVQIAFLVSEYEPHSRPNFIKLSQSCLSVFFPTEKETHLGFLVQGPYITTPARNSVPTAHPFNIALAKETGELVVEALRWLRDREWLTVDVLETMPLAYLKNEYGYEKEVNPYRWTLFAPIYEAVKHALMGEALIPAFGGGYVAAQDARIAGSVALRTLLDTPQLQHLLGFNDQTQWISEEITEDRTRDLWQFLTTILEVEEINADKFVAEIDREFLINQTDDWICEFYEYASRFNNRSFPHTSPFNILKRKPIIRLENCNHVAPYKNHWDDKPQAYLPTEHVSQFPTVKREICDSENALVFLKKLGLKKADDVDEVLTYILPKYKDGQEIDDAEHQKDIANIVRALREDSQERKDALMKMLKATPFLRAVNALGVVAFRKPGEIYFRNHTLEMYFEGNSDGWFISPQYEQFFDDLEQLDIFHGVRLRIRKPNHLGFVKFQTPHKGSESFPHKRGLERFDPEFTIDGLGFALSKPSYERSSYIWNRLLIPRKHSIVGVIESCPVQTFPSARTTVEPNVLSIVGNLVRASAWLPAGNGNFVKPSELLLENLPKEFRRDNDLADALGIRASKFNIDDAPDEIKELVAATQGRSTEELKEALGLLDEKKKMERETVETLEPDEFQRELESRFNLPDDHIPSPVHRSDPPGFPDITPGERLEDDIENEPDPDVRYELRMRRIWQTRNPGTRKFLEMEYGGNCQICDFTFEQRNKTNYFEAVHLIPRTSASWLDDPRNALCLCANHSKQFQHGELSTPDTDILEQIASYEDDQRHDVLIMLCEEPQLIRFTAKHIAELKALIDNR